MTYKDKDIIEMIINAVWEATDGGVKLKESQFYHCEELNGEVERFMNGLNKKVLEGRKPFNSGCAKCGKILLDGKCLDCK